ncbi:MAG: MaoC family dehydratase [Zoogloeaceae bacterium]|nr:MaoC family dehydratase [Zoogloeaceae bacterium]MCK6384783.1 MaoC family dehydratase [Rhodocyclaceae bacterium]
MAKITIQTPEDLKHWVGKEVAVSDWLTVDQDRIDRFADATGDHQWIHVDPVRAKAESPFGATIAHGYLTLSLLPHMMMETLDVQGGRMSINYGLNRARFSAPVRAGDRIRSRFTLAALEDIPGGIQLTWHALIEIEGSNKPACVAEMIARRYV